MCIGLIVRSNPLIQLERVHNSNSSLLGLLSLCTVVLDRASTSFNKPAAVVPAAALSGRSPSTGDENHYSSSSIRYRLVDKFLKLCLNHNGTADPV